MKNVYLASLFSTLLLAFVSCVQKNTSPSRELISGMDLKRGPVVSCGIPGEQFGVVLFDISGSKKVKEDFELALKLLHSFEYDEAEKVFASIIDIQPDCAMAYWGVAMSNFHPLWTPPTEQELKKGFKAIEIARTLVLKSTKESEYINAVASYYDSWNRLNHLERCINFEKAMEKLHAKYPRDPEAAVFYALALTAAADPTDKSFKKQKKAGFILNSLYSKQPNHPGIVHYIIHTYDYPELAHLALPAARKYASVAPSSSHALHMPSHIFTRLGLWDESINSNLASVSSSQCYAEATGIKGHWDEELHGLDYLVYSYLQKGDNIHAKEQLDYLKSIKEVSPVNFKVAYAFAAIPSRYVLENRLWKEAAHLQIYPANFPWKDYPWQKAIVHFTRLMGFIHLNNIGSAKRELAEMSRLHNILLRQKDLYKAAQVQVQIVSGKAWLLFKEGKDEEALKLMNSAAQMEDQTEKHPVTPSEVLPARELLGDLYFGMEEWNRAFKEYEASLKKHPNRFNALYGAGLASEKSGDSENAKFYYRRLLKIVSSDHIVRPEVIRAKKVLELPAFTKASRKRKTSPKLDST